MGTQGTATDIVIPSAVRTPVGTFGGTLRDVSAVDLTVVAARTAMSKKYALGSACIGGGQGIAVILESMG